MGEQESASFGVGRCLPGVLGSQVLLGSFRRWWHSSLLLTIGCFDDVEVGVAPEFSQSRRGPCVPGIGHCQIPVGKPHTRIRHEMGQFVRFEPEGTHLVWLRW